MDIVFVLLFLVTLVMSPPIAVWHVLSRPRSGGAAWLAPVLALLGPWITVYAVVVLIWLPGYSGRCGGWLGETTACSGFGQYAAETLFWAAMSTAVPGVCGVVLGTIVMLVRWIQRRRFRTRL